jgi:hypothetical protein
VTLPVDEDYYDVYRFTTPRGEVQITARAASNRLYAGVTNLATLLMAVLLGVCLLQIGRRGGFAWLASRHGSTLLIGLGMLSILLFLLPIAGLVALVAGVAVKIRRWVARHRVTKPSVATANPD